MTEAATENVLLSGLGYDEDEVSRSVVQSLSDAEKEIAARVSYRYYLTASSDKPPSHAERDSLAQDLARRFLFVEGGKADRAITRMKSTLKYRDEVLRIDDIRESFLHTNNDASSTDKRNQEEQNMEEKRFGMIKNKLEQQIENTHVFVRGCDKSKRPIIRSNVYTHRQWDETYYVVLHEFLMDRALAAAERDGEKHPKVTVIFDWKNASRKNEAPLSITKKLIFTLRDHYPEFVEHIFMLDAPLLFRIFWAIVKPFIDQITKKKIKFAKRTDPELSKYMSDDEIMFGTDGTLENVVLKKYINDIPYNCDIDGK